ncbi:methionine aminopeptidase [Candidatus Carsonella ruddii HT isolate Thao2000]|uniref:Methionine aminopeptidase n=1 Tax=Candidatus Carsonella ruddii HT isolate Thao2000 TaxID=1202539 RepID=J3TW83_CARRU|nr:methionine aminopeptidase [Candidatus Carsonella ruddii]AFP84065.1 methionine aminopeptidase [Candidatus Carsonella ruddii HT isolate Thao2000]
MNNSHNFLKCGYLNNFIITIINNYKCNNNLELDYIILYYIKKINCRSSTINYNNYKFSSCLSIENIICHGIPIKNFYYNYLKIDVSIYFKYYYSDNCYISNYYRKINFFLKKNFFNIINLIKINKNIIINNIKNKNIFINENYCSHGIFKKLHNNLIIYNNNKKTKLFDTFTIEPMFIFFKKNGYLYKNNYFSIKNNLSFQWEHTLFIFKNKKILTTIKKSELCFL